MAFALILVGLLLTIAGVKGTHGDLATLVKGDFTGKDNFMIWVAVVAALGSLGYISAFKGFSVAFLSLVLVVMVLSNGGVFQRFMQAIGSTTLPNPGRIQMDRPGDIGLGILPNIPALRTIGMEP